MTTRTVRIASLLVLSSIVVATNGVTRFRGEKEKRVCVPQIDEGIRKDCVKIKINKKRLLTNLILNSQPQGAFKYINSISIDSGENGQDEARGVLLGPDENIYLTGYVTNTGNGRDIFLAKLNQNLEFIDSITLGGTSGGDDEGYTMAFDAGGFLYLVGYVTEAGEQHNIWLGKFNQNLDLLDEWALNGSENDSDDGYGILYDEVTGHLYVAGTLREVDEGANIFLAIFDTNLDLLDSLTMDGPINDTDKARFMIFDDQHDLFVSGSMTQAGTDYDIWLGKFEDDLTFVDQVVVAGPTTDEDKGYGVVFDGADSIFVTGTMIEPGESYNIWMAAFDTELNPLGSYTINGPEDGEDVAYMMIRDEGGRLYHTGVYTEAVGGSNIWIARFTPDMELEAWTTIDGAAGGYDTGLCLAHGAEKDLFVSAAVSDPAEGLNIWIGHFDVAGIFSDDLESGDLGAWSGVVP